MLTQLRSALGTSTLSGGPAGARVLVVDDTEAQRYTVATAVRHAGFEVVEAETGEQALAIARSMVLDAVVLDVHLPDLDGFEVCRRLKADSRSFLPVLHLSSTHTGEEDRTRGLTAGADGYLTHPFNASDLRASVWTLVRLKREVDQRVADACLNTLLQSSLDSLDDHIALLGPNGDILAVNRAWTAFAAEDACRGGAGVGQNYCAVCDQTVGNHSDGAQAIAAGIRQVLTGERAEFEHDYTCHSPAEERWFRAIVRRLPEPGPVAAIVVHVNQTRTRLAARAEAEAHARTELAYVAHHETEARFRRFVESAHEGVIATDLAGTVTYTNSRAGELLGRQYMDLVGTSFFTFVTPESAFHLRTQFQSLWRGESVTVEAELEDQAGRAVDVLASMSPIINVSGELAGALVLLADQRSQKHAERELARALRDAELDRRRLHATLEALPVGVWLAGPEGGITHTNPAADRIWRGSAPRVASPAEYGVYRGWWPESGLPIEATEWHLPRSIATGETFTGRMVEIERFDGSHGWTLNSSAPILDDTGRIIGGVVAQLDVTDRELATRERERLLTTLRAERTHLTEIFENAPAFMAVLGGPDFAYVRFNARYQELIGHRAVLGKTLLQTAPELATQGSLDRLRRVRESGEPLVMRAMRVEIVRTPGKPAETRYVDLVYQRLTALSGHDDIVVHGVDVTAQVESAAKIMESKARLRDQFAKLPVPTYLWEAHGEDDFILLERNEAAVAFDPRMSWAVGHTSRELFPASVDVRADMHRSLRDGLVVRRPAQLQRAGEDEVRHLELTIGPQPPGRVLVHAVDTTSRLELETQLRQSQKMEAVGRLAGGVAHDFNNLLTVIGAHSSFLLESLDSSDPQHEDAEAIHLAGVRAAGLTRQLLAFSRKQILKPAVIDLNASVRETQTMLSRLLGEDIDIVTELADGLPSVVADGGQIGQVLLNLAVNARDAMPSGGRLTISTKAETLDAWRGTIAPGAYVILAVRDTGVGMDASVQSRLFEPFFTTKEIGKGTGLGLATVYGIVKQSGGFITVESAPNSGTTFLVHLPIAADGEETEQLHDATRFGARGFETVLLVEDEPAVRAVARRVLRRQGYVVLEAENGHAALSVSAAFDAPIHVLLTDAVMPGLGGAEVIQRIASQRPEIKPLIMSGYTDDEIVRRGITSSAIPFLEKPFTTSTLLKAVREVLEG